MTTLEFQYQLINLQDSLKKFSYRLTADKDDANDLLQETFLKALKYKNKFTNETNFKSWTFTIMKNTFINNYRRSLLRNAYSNETKESFFMNKTTAGGYNDPESTYSAMEINHKIEYLKDILKKPFKMYMNGYKYKEIATSLNLNIGTVKSRIFLSRKVLMNQLNCYKS